MPYVFPRCQCLPLPGQQVSFTIDGTERLRWNFSSAETRPFFYPVLGPSGHALTRMGHPGAPDHDHHKSVWFAHNKVHGINFWADTSPARIRQTEWLAYHDTDDAAVMGVKLHWLDGHDPAPLLEQRLIVAVRPGPQTGETLLEVQSQFRPTADLLELEKTNFGLLAVRVAKSLSVHFGGGQLTDSEGRVGEPAIFGNAARWMDYSGPVPGGLTEGIAFIEHPSNPRHPTHWHVREDGWMGAAFCLQEAWQLRKDQPLTLRYLLYVHTGGADPAKIEAAFQNYAALPPFEIQRSQQKNEFWAIERMPAASSR